MKNETNSLYKLEALTNPNYVHSDGTVNAETEFKIDFRASSRNGDDFRNDSNVRRSKSANDFNDLDESINEEFQNKENENPGLKNRTGTGLILESKYLSGLPTVMSAEKRRGVKMGTRAFTNVGPRVSRSMEAVNTNEYLEEMSLQSVSLHCSSNSISKSTGVSDEPYILGKFHFLTIQ